MFQRKSTLSKKALKWVERLFPLGTAIAVTIVMVRVVPQSDVITMARSLAEPIVSVMAISIGFVLASIGILATSDTNTIKRFKSIKNTEHWLIRYHVDAAVFGTVSCLTCLAILASSPYIDAHIQSGKGDLSVWVVVGAYIFWFFGAYSGASFCRVLLFFAYLIDPGKIE